MLFFILPQSNKIIPLGDDNSDRIRTPLLLFPKNQVKVLFIALIIRVPAFITLGLWIALQLFSGWGSLGEKEGGGGVAYAAHIGGFVAGLLIVRYFCCCSKWQVGGCGSINTNPICDFWVILHLKMKFL